MLFNAGGTAGYVNPSRSVEIHFGTFFARRQKASGNACISICRRTRTGKTRKACFVRLLPGIFCRVGKEYHYKNVCAKEQCRNEVKYGIYYRCKGK